MLLKIVDKILTSAVLFVAVTILHTPVAEALGEECRKDPPYGQCCYMDFKVDTVRCR